MKIREEPKLPLELPLREAINVYIGRLAIFSGVIVANLVLLGIVLSFYYYFAATASIVFVMFLVIVVIVVTRRVLNPTYSLIVEPQNNSSSTTTTGDIQSQLSQSDTDSLREELHRLRQLVEEHRVTSRRLEELLQVTQLQNEGVARLTEADWHRIEELLQTAQQRQNPEAAIKANQHRLHELKLRKARLGYSTPPEIEFEIKDIEAEQHRLQELLQTSQLGEDNLKAIIEAKESRLQILSKKASAYGLSTSPEVEAEIVDLKQEIESLKSELTLLEKKDV